MAAVRLVTGEKAGVVVEVDDEMAQIFVRSGRAELVTPERKAAPVKVEKPDTPERAARQDVETRAAPVKRGPRKRP